jgi:hypothetical protein
MHSQIFLYICSLFRLIINNKVFIFNTLNNLLNKNIQNEQFR